MRVAILGASARAAAYSANRAGLVPLAADLFADRDLRARYVVSRLASYPDGLADFLRSVSADGWIYTGALENHPALLGRLAQRLPLWGCSEAVVRRVRCWEKLYGALDAAGLSFPETRRTGDGLPLDGTWLTKPIASAGGGHIERATEPLGPDDATRPLMWQKFIPGRTCSAVYVGNGTHAVLAGVTEQLLGDGRVPPTSFRYGGSIGPVNLSPPEAREVARIGATLVRAFGLKGLFGVDIVLSNQRAWTIEVNPRYTASVEILERVTGQPLVAWHLRACREHWLPPTLAKAKEGYHGKQILYAARSVVISDAFSSWAYEGATNEPWPECADIPSGGELVSAGKPVLTLFADGPTVAGLRSALSDRCREAAARLYYDS